MFTILLALSPFWMDVPEILQATEKDLRMVSELRKDSLILQRIQQVFDQEENTFPDVEPRVWHSQKLEIYHPLYPAEVHLKKIGNGGPNVVVSYTDHEGTRPHKLSLRLEQELNRVGFNGYLYYRVSGYPNPTGKELRYAATPYAFKIFLMLEAHLLGFDNILWVDARLFPIKNIDPLFEFIENHGGLFNKTSIMPTKMVCMQARQSILETIGFDPCEIYAIATQLLGFCMSRKEVKGMIKDYYHACDLGLPFFSCYPEETVLSALLCKHFSPIPYIKEYAPYDHQHLCFFSPEGMSDQKMAIYAKREGYYFFGVSNSGIATLETLQLPISLTRKLHVSPTFASH